MVAPAPAISAGSSAPLAVARRKAAEFNVVARKADVAQRMIIQGKQRLARAPHNETPCTARHCCAQEGRSPVDSKLPDRRCADHWNSSIGAQPSADSRQYMSAVKGTRLVSCEQTTGGLNAGRPSLSAAPGNQRTKNRRDGPWQTSGCDSVPPACRIAHRAGRGRCRSANGHRGP